MFQDALHAAQRLDHVRAVVVQVPKFAVVPLVRPPERVLLQHLRGMNHSVGRIASETVGGTVGESMSQPVSESVSQLASVSQLESESGSE